MTATAEYAFLRHEVLKLIGVDLDSYKSEQMQRRLATFLLRSGHPSWPAFFSALHRDPALLGKLRDALTINVTSFFRDGDKFRYLQESVLPALIQGRPMLQVWSAGCSHGQEPYSLAMLLAAMQGYSRYRILATDIDHDALDRARAGGPYSKEDVAGVSPLLMSRYLTCREGGYWVADELRRRIDFRAHNLLTDAVSQSYDLVVCRNVVIYFTADAKDRLYRRFHDALRPGGVLFVGATEFIPRAQEMGLKMISTCFFQRTDG